jgi:hypothetical protein
MSELLTKSVKEVVENLSCYRNYVKIQRVMPPVMACLLLNRKRMQTSALPE